MSSASVKLPVNAPSTSSRRTGRRPVELAEMVLINLACVVAIAGALIVGATSSRAETGSAVLQKMAANLVRPNAMTSGQLLFPSNREGYYVQAPRVKTDVVIDVNGPIARTRVTQRFENPSDGWVEGLYVFPLPEESAVDTLRMQIGDRLIEGKIKPRAEAKQIYEQAKREGKKASLLEQQRPNIFTNAVANIGPKETIVIQIEYQQTVQQDRGEFSLRFPMVVAPRYHPKPIVQSVRFSNQGQGSGWGVVDPVPDRDKISPPVLDPRENAKINPVSLTVKLHAGFPLETVVSHHHRIQSVTPDTGTRVVTLEGESVPADRDFELSWTAQGTAPTAALFHETVGEEAYILAMITPPKLTESQLSGLEKKPREIIFVIDNSGSMGGESIVQARQSLQNALRRLAPSDRFNIVRFNDTHELVFPVAVPADRENLDRAIAFVGALEAQGGTEMRIALEAALSDPNPAGSDHIRQVVFITDGAIGNEQELFDLIGTRLGRSRIFTIGIGSAPNSFFMNRASEIGRGTFTHIGSTHQVADRMDQLFTKLENPVLTGLRAVVSGGNLSEVTPEPLPDLYLGEPIVLSAKADDLSGHLTIRGDYGGTPWEVSLPLAEAVAGSGIGKLWARRQIATLEASKSRGSDSVDQAIEAIALTHHLVSRVTSLVAVDVTQTRPKGTSLTEKQVPLNLPKGWSFDSVFGGLDPSPSPLPQRAAAQSRSLQVAALMVPAPTKAAAAELARKSRAVTLPATATPAERNMVLGLLIMVLAGLVWMTSTMWRNTARQVLRSRSVVRPLHLPD